VTAVRTIPAALVAAAGSACGVRAIEHDGRILAIPYGELLADALRVAGALHAAGLAAGDRAALVVPEVGEFVRAFFGIAAGGLVPIPLVPPAQAGDVPTFTRQTRQLLIASRAAAIVTTADVAALIDLQGIAPAPRILTIEQLLDGTPLSEPVAVPAEATALVQFTSGSTAAPKGVVLTHANLCANIAAISGPRGIAAQPSDVGVSWLPLYHDMGLIGMLLSSVYARADVVILSPILFLKRPSAWLTAISEYRGTVSFAPNFAYELCVRRVKPSQLEALDLSSWRIAGCGAEPVRAETLAAFASHFASTGFRAASFAPSYGLAEHSVAVSLAVDGVTIDAVDARRLVADSKAIPIEADDHETPAVKLVCCGRPFPDHDVRIVDDERRELGERHVGQIVARGPSVMAGYFENPEATAETLRGGWLQTGDLGYMAGGQLFVCGRTKDLIIRQGRKYHPADLESAIGDVQGLRSSGVVVFAVNRVTEADEVVAVVEARASLTSTPILDHVRRRVRETAGLELDRVVVAPPGTIPRTTSGKVRRAETRARFEAGTLLTGGDIIAIQP
jgi:acyl-CoA synthetase (AMP-forming)/AMP-acid ligase II